MTAERVVGADLVLRRPEPADETDYVRIHRDPRTYAHAPHAMPVSDGAARENFRTLLDAWQDGRGYWTATLRSGEVVGFAGAARRERADGPFLNLYYRLDPAVHGRGLGRAAARLTARYVAEHDDLPLRAVIKEHNRASVGTALSIGMERIGTTTLSDDLPDEPASTVFEAPRVHRVEAFTDEDREGVLDLWCSVNDAGGAVGFLPGAPRTEVAARLADHEVGMRNGSVVAGVLRSTHGRPIGVGFLSRGSNPLLWHGRTVHRLMTDPERRRRGLGQVLMAGLHRIARADDVEIMTLDVRSGLGSESFYASCGYREVGRVEGAIRVASGDDRDQIIMSRRLDR